jgi:hypothetical protein
MCQSRRSHLSNKKNDAVNFLAGAGKKPKTMQQIIVWAKPFLQQ